MNKTKLTHAFEIRAVEVVGNSICVAQDDGQRLFEVLRAALSSGRQVSLSFSGIESLATAFLNAAVGQLLRSFESDFLRDNLKFRDLTGEQLRFLREVIERARLYFSDPERFEVARARVVET